MAAAGVRTTKGLYFTLTLLCLVFLASSLIDKDPLEKLKESVQRAQQVLDRAKEKQESNMATSAQRILESINEIEASVKKTSTLLSDDFPPAEELLESLKGFAEKSKTYIEELNEVLVAKRDELHEEVRTAQKFIEFLEENQAEL